MWNDTAQVNRNFFWKNFTNGNQSMFMDPYVLYYPRQNRNHPPNPVNSISTKTDARWTNVRDTMGYIRSYADRMNLVTAKPLAELTSTGCAWATSGLPIRKYWFTHRRGEPLR